MYERIQEHQELSQMRIDEIAESCNSFVIVPEPNGMVHLCLDPT